MRKTLSKEKLRKFKVLQAGFTLNLVPRVENLAQIIDQLQQLTGTDQDATVALIKNLVHLSHQLAGSAGNFGYPEISKKSKQFESLSEPVLLGEQSYATHCAVEFPILIAEIIKQAKLPPLVPKLEAPAEPVEIETTERDAVKHLLIVDDDEQLTELLTLQLSQYNYQVRCIHDPANLDAELSNHSPDVVLMDIGFPGEDNLGFSIISGLRKRGKLHCPLVFASGRNDIQARLSSAKANADGYIVKPINIDETVNLLDHLVSYKLTKFKVMLIDDDEAVLDLYVGKLQQTGFITEKVIDPLSTLEQLGRFNPDVILLGIDMPSCSGLDLAKVIRQSQDYLQIPIVFLKSVDQEMYKDYAFYSAGDDFIDKPVNPGELVAVVRARAQRARDIVNLQAKLKNSEARFRGFSQMAGSAVVVSDQHQRIVFWNQAAEELFGYESDDILGQDIAILVPDDTKASQQKAYSRVLELPVRRGKDLLTGKGLAKDGREIPVEISLGSWRSQGQAYISAILTDISRRQLAEQQLQQAKELAEKANLAKSEFLSSMSHELRTPLNAILGFAQMLNFNNKEPLTKTQSNCVEHILSGGKHLLELINDILDLAKIEAGKIDFYFEDISAKKLLNECVTLVASLTDAHSIKVQQVPPANQVLVRADYTRLKQIVLNLLSNAIKYNRDNGTVSISCSQGHLDNLRISITDTGFGIPKKKQHELFQPFSRLGQEGTQVEGTGIGLIVTKQLVELMGGSIGFDSEENKGSTFWVEMPMAKTSVKIEPVRVSQAAKNILPEITGTVLYVEDNPANLELMEMLVASIDGLRLISAHNAEFGIELARSERPDVVILDINLPGMNGFDALTKLKRMPETRDLPVIALTASASEQDIHQGLEAGFVKYLTKPMQIDEVVGVINSLVNPPAPSAEDIHLGVIKAMLNEQRTQH